ncbi:MAG: helix-turn-helix domain-containing protein [Bacteroidaceae bacterium]|nr:helix-turn-helix domain-containing protein [Bacteroidaceae bacterium]
MISHIEFSKNPHAHTCFLGNVTIRPDKNIKLHSHPTWEIYYVIKGVGTRIIGDTVEPFSEGEVVLVPPEVPHCWEFGTKVTGKNGMITSMALMFSSELPKRCLSAFPEFKEVMTWLESNKNAFLFSDRQREIAGRYFESMKEQQGAELTLSLLSLLYNLSRESNGKVCGNYKRISTEEYRFNRVDDYVISNYMRTITLDEVAQYVNMNRSSFCVFFKKYTGKKFTTYLNEYRIHTACKLLKQHNYSIAEVAYMTGFNCIPYFNVVFRRIIGTAPQTYRAKST